MDTHIGTLTKPSLTAAITHQLEREWRMRTKPLVLLLATALTAVTACTQADDLPAPLQAIQEHGVEIVGEFDAPAGLKGYAAIMNQRAVTIYLTEDGEYALVGYMMDSDGELIGQEALQRLVIAPRAERVWAKLGDSAWIPDGNSDAPQVAYVFTDPNCPYCHMFWKRVRPWVESGRVQLRHVLVGVIAPSSSGKAATILSAENPEAALIRNEHTFDEGGVTPLKDIPPAVQAKLASNQRLMQQFNFRGTPGIVYRDEQGRLQRWRGVPSVSALKQAFGPK